MSLTPRYMCPATASRLLGAVDAPGMSIAEGVQGHSQAIEAHGYSIRGIEAGQQALQVDVANQRALQSHLAPL